jgi:AAA domain
MPTLVNLLRHYLSVRFGGSPAAVVAEVRRVTPSQSFRPVGLQDFLALQMPRREMLLAPILPERSLSMLYAPRGIGKSWLGLTIGLAVSSGSSVLQWTAQVTDLGAPTSPCPVRGRRDVALRPANQIEPNTSRT